MPESNSLGNANLIIWVAAVLSLLLLLLIGMMAEIIVSPRRDFAARVVQTAVFTLIPLLAFVPALTLAVVTDGAVTYALAFYVVLYALFCYYLGKRVGVFRGKKQISELVGLDTADSIEDAQDRLFESRMRLLSRSAVVESIGRMAKEREAQRLEEERVAAGRAPTTTEVDAEEVEIE